jgi:DNA-binding XRE family transcriptional regulator
LKCVFSTSLSKLSEFADFILTNVLFCGILNTGTALQNHSPRAVHNGGIVMTFGEKLKNLRISCEKTQAEVAKAIDVSQSAYCMYETGERVPRDEIKIRIAKYYGRTVNTILYAD